MLRGIGPFQFKSFPLRNSKPLSKLQEMEKYSQLEQRKLDNLSRIS